jgi:hypothetical protein
MLAGGVVPPPPPPLPRVCLVTSPDLLVPDSVPIITLLSQLEVSSFLNCFDQLKKTLQNNDALSR